MTRLLLLAAALLAAPAAAQNLISTGATSGLRLYMTNGNDFWLDPTSGNALVFKVNGNAVSTMTAQGFWLVNGVNSVSNTGVTASSFTATVTGNTQYSLQSASGIIVNNGGGVKAAFFDGIHVGDGSRLTGISGGSPAAGSVTPGTFVPGVLLPAGNLINGPLASSVLPSSVPYTSVTNNFTASQGFGTASPQATLDVNGSAQFGSGANKSTFTASGTLSGPANDYDKAQASLSGGGTVTWGGGGGRLKWTGRFIAIPLPQRTASAGYIDIYQCSANIPAGQVFDGVARACDAASGVILNGWEALYAEHAVGGSNGAVTFRIVQYTYGFSAPSNWILVGAVNGDDGSIRLGTGMVLKSGGSFTAGVDAQYAQAGGSNASGTWGINISGNAATATSASGATALAANGANCSAGNAPLGVDASGASEGCFDVATQVEMSQKYNLAALDDRTISPSEISNGNLVFGFTSWTNNNASPFADFLHLRGYTDSSGGNDNLVVFRKDQIGMRIYQQAFGSATAYSTYKDMAFTDGSNASGTWGIAISGNAATASALAANGGDCAAGSFPLGVNASGAAESCTTVSSLAPTLTGGGASGTWGISISGNAATATSATSATSASAATRLASSGDYVWNAATLAQNLPNGITNSFVQAADGWPNYGTLINARSYSSGGGGGLQLYSPYGSGYGGTALRYRTADYSADSVNPPWTAFKTLLDSANYNSYAPTLTGGGASGSWGINITGSAGSAASATTASSLAADPADCSAGNAPLGVTASGAASGCFDVATQAELNSYGASASVRYLSSPDGDRANHIAPNALVRNLQLDFKNASAVGGTGNYSGVLTYSPWDGTTASTGDPSYQIAFYSNAANGNLPRMRIRNGIDTTWNSWYNIWNASSDGAGSGLDADLLDGLEMHAGTNNEANKVVRTDASGYIQAGWINTISGDNGTTAISRVYASNDGYIRYYTLANFAAQIRAQAAWNAVTTGDYPVAQVLRWKNYGQNHVIFDASAGTAPDGTAVNNTNPQVAWAGTYPTLMGWNGANTYGVRTYISNLADLASNSNQLGGLGAASFLRKDTSDTMAGNITYSNLRYSDIGVYDPVNTQSVWAMGAAYTLPVGGATNNYGNFYGLGWSYNPDYGGAGNNPQSKAGLNHQLLLMMAGVTQTALGNGIWTNGNITGTGNLTLTPANPSITSGGSYITIPNGLYISGGTPYFQNQIQARGGVHDDTNARLTLYGGTGGDTQTSGAMYFGTGGSYRVTSAGAGTLATTTLGSVLPPGDGTVGYDVGRSALRWASMHAVGFYGSYFAGPDVAERYPSAEALEAGELVVFDHAPDPKLTVLDQSATKDGGTVVAGKRVAVAVRRTTRANQPAIGVVSTAPGVSLQDPGDEKKPPVALMGRVPVKVTDEGGDIAIGDYLAASSKPGVAMKAASSAPTIGVALQAHKGKADGRILAFIRAGNGDGTALQRLEEKNRSLEERVQRLERLLEK